MIKYPEEIKMDIINRTLAARKHRKSKRRQIANNCDYLKNGGIERRVNITDRRRTNEQQNGKENQKGSD